MREVEYGDTVTPPVGYEGRTWYDKSDPDKKVIDFENYPIVRDTTFVLHRIDGDDVYILNPLGEMNITLSKDEAIVTTCLFTSTKNGEYYNNVQMSFLEECDWIQNIDMIEDSANNTIGFQFIVDELPQEIYENGRSITAIIIQLDTGGVSREFEIRQFGYCPPITENTTGTTSLDVKLCGVDTNENLYINNTIQGNTYISFVACGTMLINFVKNNTGGIIINGSNSYSLIDDEYMLVVNRSSFGNWSAGSGSGGGFSSDFTIYPNNDNSITTTLKFRGGNDEEQDLLLYGAIVNKAIRVPYKGIDGKISITQYPYNFTSPFFFEDPKLYFIENIVEDNNNIVSINDFSHFQIGNFNGSFYNTNSVLDYMLEYEIEENDTCDYKHHVVCLSTKDLNNNSSLIIHFPCVVLHFIQEYNVRNRIYYSSEYLFYHVERFDDKYNETQSNDYQYHCWFETCSSKILLEDTINMNSCLLIAYPNSEDFEYEFSISGNYHEVLSTNYMWGEKTYTIIKNDYKRPITFTKN